MPGHNTRLTANPKADILWENLTGFGLGARLLFAEIVPAAVEVIA